MEQEWTKMNNTKLQKQETTMSIKKITLKKTFKFKIIKTKCNENEQ